MGYETKDNWYAVFVTTGDEDNVKERINYKLNHHLRAIVPKRKMRERKGGEWKDKLRALFPGYILLNGRVDCEVCSLIRDVPGVIRLLKNSDGPQRIHKSEIEVISRLITNNEIIESSIVCIEGENVVVVDGPLMGLEGYIQSIDKRKGRVKVVLNLLGEPRAVELSVALVQPA